MSACLYVIPLSNPAGAARGMLAHKRLPHRLITLPPGLHAPLVRAAGFGGFTVPALELGDGRMIQGSLAIPRVLDGLLPERPLYPPRRGERRAVEDAERWGHSELQPVPRRIFRWAMTNDPALRRWLSTEILGAPAPRVGAAVGRVVAGRMAAIAGASEAQVRDDVARLPALLDRVDGFLAAGTIGDPEAPNAADFQLLATVRAMLEFQALPEPAEGRACAAAARRLFASWDGPIPPTPLPGVAS